MSELEKYAYIRCRECGQDNRLIINSQRAGHYQCGSCQSHLMFYGTEKQSKYKNWIWAIIISTPIAFIGYQNIPIKNNWTNKNVQKFEKTCKSKYVQITSWSSRKIESYCQCLTNTLTEYKYEDVLKSPGYYLNSVTRNCRNDIESIRYIVKI